MCWYQEEENLTIYPIRVEASALKITGYWIEFRVKVHCYLIYPCEHFFSDLKGIDYNIKRHSAGLLCSKYLIGLWPVFEITRNFPFNLTFKQHFIYLNSVLNCLILFLCIIWKKSINNDSNKWRDKRRVVYSVAPSIRSNTKPKLNSRSSSSHLSHY